jgi:hypothetical protein
MELPNILCVAIPCPLFIGNTGKYLVIYENKGKVVPVLN